MFFGENFKNYIKINNFGMKKIFTIFSAMLLSVGAFAEFGYNVTFAQSDFNNNTTVVKTEGTIEWDADAVRCGGAETGNTSGPAWNWNDKYFVIKLADGVPNKLSFQYKGNKATGLTPSSGVDYNVKESVDGENWDDLWSTTTNTSEYQSVSKELKTTTKYLRFCWSGNFAGLFKDIKVTEQILMGTANPESLDFGTVKVDDVVDAQTFTINYTGMQPTATSSDAHFTVTPESFGSLNDYKVTQTITVGLLTNEAGEYSGTITVEGRGKSATVAVTAKVEKHDQSIDWAPAESYNWEEAVALATATSGLDVAYEISDPTVLVFESGAFRALHGGTVTVTAKQEGNYKYNAAAPVEKTITIVPPTTYGNFEETSCDKVTFNGTDYSESFADDVKVGENMFGGDSIVHVNITINKPSFTNEEKTITFGDEVEWNGFQLGDSAVGTHTVVYVTTNVVGCDSIVTLALTVEAKSEDPTGLENAEMTLPTTKEFRNGVMYIRRGENLYGIDGRHLSK